MSRRSIALEREAPYATVEINIEDAKDLGLKDRHQIKIISRRGTIVAEAFVTERIKRGVIYIPFHYAESAVNLLTTTAKDPIAKIPELKICAVRIEKT